MLSAMMFMQVEETFMQHVVQYWQGSLTEVDGTAAMQSDPEAAAYRSPLNDQGAQTKQTPREDHQEGDPSNSAGSYAQTRRPDAAGKYSLVKFCACCFSQHAPLSSTYGLFTSSQSSIQRVTPFKTSGM